MTKNHVPWYRLICPSCGRNLPRRENGVMANHSTGRGGPECANSGVSLGSIGAKMAQSYRQTQFHNSGPGDRCDHCGKPLREHSPGNYYCPQVSAS